MQVTYHLVPRAEWEATDPGQPYVPAAFASDGFVHCTDGAQEVAATANRYYSGVADLLVLSLDVTRLDAPVRYEDPKRIYPHVYGPIPRAAVADVQPMRRGADGAWAPPR
jgi:uncharacterized protein (DUF952 family)